MRRSLFFLLIASGAPASAQLLPEDQSLVTFSRYTAVRERQLAGYAVPGIPLASFTLQPSLDVSTTYNTNVLALSHDAPGDLLVRLSPSLTASSNWSTSLLSLSAAANVDRYASLTSENTVDVNSSIYGYTDLSHATRLRALTRFQTERESRESEDVFVLTRRPIRFRNTIAGIGLNQRLASALVLLEGDIWRRDFDDAVRRDDRTPVDEDFRDSVLKRARARVELGQSSTLAWFVQGTYDVRDYRLRATDPLASARDSRIAEYLAGARFELPVLMRGEVGIGYTKGDYRSTRLNTVSGVAVRTEVTFFPTQLTNVVVTAERRVNDTGLPASGGYSSLVGGVRVDHELLRQLVLSGTVRYERDAFNGVDRIDSRKEFSASGAYRLNPNISARASFSRIDLTSRGADAYKSFVANRFLLGVGLRP